VVEKELIYGKNEGPSTALAWLLTPQDHKCNVVFMLSGFKAAHILPGIALFMAACASMVLFPFVVLAAYLTMEPHNRRAFFRGTRRKESLIESALLRNLS